MASVFADLSDLKEKARFHKACLVSFSTGKDSLAVMDLCTRAFDRVIPFFMYLVPGLSFIEERLADAHKRWGTPVLQFPHWVLFKCLRNGIYCPNHHSFDDLPNFKLFDIYEMVVEETGIPIIAHGGKTADGLWRRRMMSATGASKKCSHIFYPIRSWSKYDVMAYLDSRKIPIPQESKDRRAAGVDLGTSSLLWMHDNHPEDFKKLCETFQYADSVVARRTFYNVT